ncbi:MAG: hypothetical protein DKM50_00140 [Candidatus Margulisiibacteriota bacterium]|nr:MAG: hypothetical protein A2X43_02720 [Candidatus Margulisbacteria bacterium GWD2_39_127]OGI02746.1 MAG: hypothetical protein A2X42_01755 [Candidatus Margulisbacteria bacterium GWF2_38_17]OGI09368.1 MAG: hypothetical protein A2X41_09620 [Candidatus Margulisbacteria bacterium GWE2_39_32]PZM84945.1 MAG: hypothetical protein DKM50_00140 [Candidatus Margulisiibacteriota bacterium]HAR63649.1 hypothetical protein [Candidatus Margulisiibacteriota bacterium]
MGRVMDGPELLMTRRSIRDYANKEVPEEVLWRILDFCRYAPTSNNSESYYFVVIKNRDICKFLSNLRAEHSEPLANAPMAVAICTDPMKTRRVIEDGCIAAYHFILSAWMCRVGTCWIGGMDRDDVKEKLKIPKEHYISSITPLGYPAEIPEIPPRRNKENIVKFLV